ncbi:hypothetical protein JZ785_10615 [Alicyclobacillus curvatus]|nr:hypothetical protein JZ785_10615 [Alicyclobacillus curvatus]
MLDKMRYALSDIQITRALLQINNSSFFKRAISRLVPIRVPDLIRYAREVNNDPSNGRSLQDRRSMKGNLNALDELYQEYMADLRNKFGGHLKDIDFFERIQLWGTINEDDTQFFVEQVQELASELASGAGSLTIPTVGLADSEAIKRISASHDIEGKPTIASDALALTRYNTVSAIQTHELPAKAKLLLSLQLIINYELSLLQEVRQTEVVRALKCLILVDVVNFFDNLFTRPIDPNAKQAMDGLDVIVERNGLTEAVNLFRTAKTETRIAERAEKLRSTRNVIAAHLDKSLPLSTIISQLDAVRYEEISELYELMSNVFEAVCRSDKSLSMVLLGPAPIAGVVGLSQQPQSGFTKGPAPQTTFSAPTYLETEMDEMWLLLESNPDDREALSYFRSAMMHSAVIDEWSETVQLGEHAERTETHEIRIVHKFLQQKVQLARGDRKNTALVIHALTQGKNPEPTALRIVEEEYKHVPETLKDLFVFSFGELARVRDSEVVNSLIKRVESKGDLNEVHTALIALLKIDVNHNGIRHLNRHVPSMGPQSSEGKLDDTVLGLLDSLPSFYQTLLALTMLGQLWLNPYLGRYRAYTEEVYLPRLESALRIHLPELLAGTGVSNDRIESILNEGISTHTYSRMAIQIGDALKSVSQPESQAFYQIVARDHIPVDWRQEGLVTSRAIGLARLGEFEEAVTTGLYLCDTKPHVKSYRLFALQLAAEGKLSTEFETIVAKLYSDFVLNADDEATIKQLKTWL